uniref:Uncharacterized protein n=1 Tax=Oryza glaberrima TaxID=4538 RepID=I1PL17_ORYGL
MVITCFFTETLALQAEIIKRLQREKFVDMIKHMDGHEQIYRLVALYTSSAKVFHLPELPVRVKVALDAAGALLLVDGDELEQARDRLVKARNTTGLSSRFVFESSTRGGKDTVTAELATGLGVAAVGSSGGGGGDGGRERRSSGDGKAEKAAATEDVGLATATHRYRLSADERRCRSAFPPTSEQARACWPTHA